MSIAETLLPYMLFVVGGRMTWSGARVWVLGAGRSRGSTRRLLHMVIGFRQAIVGLAVIGGGFWLLTGSTWILILSLAVAAEEVFETGTIIKALRSDPRLREERRAANRSAPEMLEAN
jgi:hypothetical protein